MKKTTLLVLAFTALYATAQKVDLDRYNFNYTFRRLPVTPLPPDYKTYNFIMATSDNMEQVFDNDMIESSVSIDGLKKVKKQGHITIKTMMSDVSLRDPQLKEREEVIKDKNGKETGRKKYYWVEAIYTWNADANVTDYKGGRLHRLVFASGEANTWKSSEYENSSAPGDYYNNNRYSIRNGLATTLANNAMKSLNASLNSKYGYSPFTLHDILWIMDSKKHPEQDGMQNAWSQFKSAVASMNASDSLGDFRAKMVPVMAYFESLKTKYTGSDKSDKKLRYAAYYCLAKIYMLLDNPDAAMKEADLLSGNDYDEKDGKYLRKEAEELKALFEKNKIYTRHFPVDISQYTAPAVKDTE